MVGGRRAWNIFKYAGNHKFLFCRGKHETNHMRKHYIENKTRKGYHCYYSTLPWRSYLTNATRLQNTQSTNPFIQLKIFMKHLLWVRHWPIFNNKRALISSSLILEETNWNLTSQRFMWFNPWFSTSTLLIFFLPWHPDFTLFVFPPISPASLSSLPSSTLLAFFPLCYHEMLMFDMGSSLFTVLAFLPC